MSPRERRFFPRVSGVAQSERKRTRLWIEIIMRRKLRSKKLYRKIELFAYIFLSTERNQGAFLMPKMAILSKEAVM